MGFDEEARNWDTERRISRAKIIADEIGNAIRNGRSRCAMEFGCGTGLISFNLCDSFKNITLIDSSKGMIDILNDKIQKNKKNNMTAKNLNLADGDMINENFDVIYSSMALHHIKDIESMIEKLYQLLNNYGYLCIVDMNEDDGSFHKGEPDFDGHNGFNQEILKNILTGAGFNDTESKTFYYDEKIIEGKSVGYSLFLMKARKCSITK